MKIKRILLNLVKLTVLVFVTSSLNAQVCIGSLEAPESGALLQLKSIEDVDNGGANAFGGLGMPKVALTSITDLYPMFPTVYEKNVHDLPHTGLMVYNVNENLFNGDGKGLYVWDGAKWTGIGLIARRISATPTSIYLSAVKPELDAKLTTIPENLAWTMTATQNIGSSSYSARDYRNDLVFKKSETAVYGNKTYTFTIDNSDKHIDINVSHIGLTLNKTLFRVGENGTVLSSAVVLAEGGDADWFVKSYTQEGFNWTSPPQNSNGALSFTLGAATQVGTVQGTITVAHVNDPALTKEITIRQNKDYIILPEFDYLVIQYVYAVPAGFGSVDLDTGTEISGTEVAEVNNQAVGWALKDSAVVDEDTVNEKSFLYWPGDNVTTGYESVYANMTILTDQILPSTGRREFNVDMYATWYSPSITTIGSNNKISIKITLYRGGTMSVLNRYDYKNTGGAKVFELTKTDLPVTTYRGVNSFRTSYTKMLRLEYDRVDNTGILLPFVANRMAVQHEDIPEMLPDETKDEYVKRINEYREQAKKSAVED